MTRPLVYFIDDDLELTKVIERRFHNYGCDVKTFTDPNTLFSSFKNDRPKLVMVDLNLGDGLSGFDIIKTIRDELKDDVPIIIISSDKDQKQIAHGLEIGANDYTVKPPLRIEFENVISQYLSTPHLPEPPRNSFFTISSHKNRASLVFRTLIEEVHSSGFALLSDHLVKKGVTFYLLGDQLSQVTPTCKKILVNVISSATKTVEDQKKFQLQVEVDPSQELALNEIQAFLALKFSDKIKQ